MCRPNGDTLPLYGDVVLRLVEELRQLEIFRLEKGTVPLSDDSVL